MMQRSYKIITYKELKNIAKQTFDKCLYLLSIKNSDYSKIEKNNEEKEGGDSLLNFRRIEEISITTAEKGAYVRLTDKLMRIANFLNKQDLAVKDETINDTIEDAINYLVILKALLISYKGEIISNDN